MVQKVRKRGRESEKKRSRKRTINVGRGGEVEEGGGRRKRTKKQDNEEKDGKGGKV